MLMSFEAPKGVFVHSDDDENMPVWPTWAVGVLSGVRDVETFNRGLPSYKFLRGCLNSPSLISCGTEFLKVLRNTTFLGKGRIYLV